MSNKIFVTKEGLKKLQDELIFLKEEKRVEIAAKLKEAISF
jgi:transcription elongation GreA/GreB family factor